MNADELTAFVRHFREAAPYIGQLRGKTVVAAVSGRLLDPDRFRPVAADLALLAGLGIRIVLICGSRSQISAACAAAGIATRYHLGRRITDEAVLDIAKQTCGRLQADVEAALSAALTATPQRGRLRTASGNFVTARPLGVIDGIDMGYTGTVRKTDADALRAALDSGALVIVGTLAASLSGKTLSLAMTETAEAVAIALQAEKLLFLISETGILDEQGRLLESLSSAEGEGRLKECRIADSQRTLLRTALNAVAGGVRRCQILSGADGNGLIGELFSRSGSGTAVAQAPFERIRPADSGDIPGITALIRPLEARGILLRRSREYLENHIGSFFVLEHDGRICGCAALKTFSDTPGSGELACLAVSPDTQAAGCGERLLEHLLTQARSRGLHRLFALSTQTGEWFLERGFQTASPGDLPAERRREYETGGRRPHIFVRATD